jgi:presenilin-like A22 family membrane protease
VEVHLVTGTRLTASSFQVVGSLLMAVLDPAKPRENYALLNPSAIAAYLPGAVIPESAGG